MSLVTHTAGRIDFNLSAITRHAHHESRFARRLCRTAADQRRHLSNWLRRAWAVAKAEAATLTRPAEHAAAIKTLLLGPSPTGSSARCCMANRTAC